MEALDPFSGQTISIHGRRYRYVEARLLDWLERQCDAPLDPRRPRTFCGVGTIPPGYTRRGSPYECLKKGIKTGICAVHARFQQS